MYHEIVTRVVAAWHVDAGIAAEQCRVDITRLQLHGIEFAEVSAADCQVTGGFIHIGDGPRRKARVSIQPGHDLGGGSGRVVRKVCG